MAYKEELTLKAKGLHTYADSLGTVPEGSLQVATNVVLDKNDLISPRRGFETLDGTILGAIGSMHTFTNAAQVDTLISHRDDTTLARYDDGGSAWVDYSGTYAPPSSAESIRSAESNKNFYFTTDKGVQKLDAATGTPIDAGAPEGLDITLSSTSGGSLNFTNTDSASYRVVWGYKDANDNLVLGAPSNSFLYTATAANDPVLRVDIPTPPVDATWFVQLYRTDIVLASTATGDNMALALERNPDGADITAGFILLTDLTPNELLGAELYTNATQEGLLNSNFQPPQCTDMALFQNHMFYANTETKYEFLVTLLATLALDDTVTIDGTVYTAKAAEAPASQEFKFFNASTVSQDIESTARSLISVLNNKLNTSNTTLWGTYISGVDDLPGRMRFFERDYGDAIDFTTASSVGTSFSPDLTSAVTSTNNKNPNHLFYSKIQEPEAVPVLNFFPVGPANDTILRILPLRSVLLIFTSTAIYRMSGTTAATFQVTLLDNTAKLIAPESLVPLNNTACGLFDQGVSRVSNSSVQIISRPIEGELLSIIGATGTTLSDLSFGVSYESDRKYLLALPTASANTINQIFYVYNTITNSWTTYDLQKSSGIVRPSDDKLYLAESSKVSRERKDFSSTDYSEEGIPVTATVISGDDLTITLASVADARVGYIYSEASSTFSVITAVDTLNSTITVTDPLAWTTGAAELLPYITTTITWNPITANSPNLLKQFAECTLIVETPLQDATLAFSTPSSSGFESVNIIDTAEGPWGLFPWGDAPWGGLPLKTRYRTYVPRNKQKDSYITPRLTQNTVYNGFEISGLSFYFRVISNRVTR